MGRLIDQHDKLILLMVKSGGCVLRLLGVGLKDWLYSEVYESIRWRIYGADFKLCFLNFNFSLANCPRCKRCKRYLCVDGEKSLAFWPEGSRFGFYLLLLLASQCS